MNLYLFYHISNMMQPFIILLDIDGTIIGNITYQVLEWELSHAIDKSKLKYLRQTITQQLQQGLVRPFFADFISLMLKRFENVEFYVYTASDTNWASFLVPCIEKSVHVSFHRPLLTRKHCIFQNGYFMKSINKVAPCILKRLKGKYQNLTTRHIIKNTILIDNNDVLIDNRHRLIRFPTYDWSIMYDVLRHFNIDSSSDLHPKYLEIFKKYNIVNEDAFNKTSAFLSQYYSNLSKHIQRGSDKSDEKYWLSLYNLFLSGQRKGLDKDALVKYINQRLTT